ncbi:MAG: hypothetical protein SV062_15010 [Thermodesulfobacteriota bacterium]|nr:hypothetical protein [Thermodesulfobacteriota bacterium]
MRKVFSLLITLSILLVPVSGYVEGGVEKVSAAKRHKKGEYITERIKNLTPKEKEKIKESSLIASQIIKNLTAEEKERLKSSYENCIDTLTSIPVEDKNQLKHNYLYLVR